MFLFIVALTFVVQVSIVQWGGRSVRSVPLSTNENIICAAIGAGTLVWAVLIKAAMPPAWFSKLAVSEKPMTDEEADNTMVAAFKASKSFRNRSIKAQGKQQELW